MLWRINIHSYTPHPGKNMMQLSWSDQVVWKKPKKGRKQASVACSPVIMLAGGSVELLRSGWTMKTTNNINKHSVEQTSSHACWYKQRDCLTSFQHLGLTGPLLRVVLETMLLRLPRWHLTRDRSLSVCVNIQLHQTSANSIRSWCSVWQYGCREVSTHQTWCPDPAAHTLKVRTKARQTPNQIYVKCNVS